MSEREESPNDPSHESRETPHAPPADSQVAENAASRGAVAEEAPESTSEATLFFGMSSARLRSRVRWASVIFLLSVVVPHDIIDSRPLFVWSLLPELPFISAVAALALPLLGASLFIATFVTRRATSLAAVVLAGFALGIVARTLGSDRAAWDVFALPESFDTRPAQALVALALAAAGASLSFRTYARKMSRYFLVGGAVSALLFYAWPSRTEAPFATLFRAIRQLPDLPDGRFVIGSLLLIFIALWPLAIALIGLRFIKHPATKEEPGLSLVAVYGLPAVLIMFAYRALMFAEAGLGLLVYLFTIGIVAAVLATLTSAFTVTGEALSISEPNQIRGTLRADESQKPLGGLIQKHALFAASVAFLLLSIVLWILARPPKKGTQWELTGRSETADALFSKQFRSWTAARRAWDQNTRSDVGASARVEVKAAAKELREASLAIDPRLGEAMTALVAESDDLDLAGRKWNRLIADVNEASRSAKLPYYVDPTFLTYANKDGTTRRFYAFSYRIEAVHRYEVDGRELATLLVEQLGHKRDSHFRLGFSRDADPFALVVLDELDAFAGRVGGWGQSGRCGGDAHFGHAERASEICARLTREVVERASDKRRELLISATERHELQHQIDGPLLSLAPRVLARLSVYEQSFQDRVNRELSAYIAETSLGGDAARLGLLHLASFVIGSNDGAYHHAAVLTFESLADKNLRSGTEPNGTVDGEAFADVLESLVEKDDAALADRARAAYEETFDEELPTPKLIP